MSPAVKWSIIVICLMLIWGSIVTLFYLKADEVTKNPCSICANKLGKKVTCTNTEFKPFETPSTITFYPNFSISNG